MLEREKLKKRSKREKERRNSVKKYQVMWRSGGLIRVGRRKSNEEKRKRKAKIEEEKRKQKGKRKRLKKKGERV